MVNVIVIDYWSGRFNDPSKPIFQSSFFGILRLLVGNSKSIDEGVKVNRTEGKSLTAIISVSVSDVVKGVNGTASSY